LNSSCGGEIGEKGGDYAKDMFDEAGNIVKLISSYENDVREKLTGDDLTKADLIADFVRQTTQQYLLSAIPLIRGENVPYKQIDIVNTLRSFRRQVHEMYSSYYGINENPDDRRYEQLLNLFRLDDPDINIKTLAQSILERVWEREEAREKIDTAKSILKESDEFYESYDKKLYDQVNETTGDTQQQLSQFEAYLQRRASEGLPVTGNVLDMGCGDGNRITKEMAKMLPGQVTGIDRRLPLPTEENTAHFAQGDFTKIPLPENSVELATAHWSVLNDLVARSLQKKSLGELQRVMKLGGEFYFDIPYLEGGEGSWMETAQGFKKDNPQASLGDIIAVFPEGDKKKFHIYPEGELRALLESAGFSIAYRNEWTTGGGRKRLTMIARLDRKVTPSNLNPNLI